LVSLSKGWCKLQAYFFHKILYKRSQIIQLFDEKDVGVIGIFSEKDKDAVTAL